MISLTFHASGNIKPNQATSASIASSRDISHFDPASQSHARIQSQATASQVAEQHFFKLPEQQLHQYAELRGRSELGRIFHVANGLHEHIDAIVVLGSRQLVLGARALMQACCDPYHNELSRADRGSKPRVYFAGDGYDNDATASLLQRLPTTGEERTKAETRFAILVCLDADSEPVCHALPHFVNRLKTQLGEECSHWLPRLVIPIEWEGYRGKNPFGSTPLNELKPQFRFTIPNQLSGPTAVFSSATLLPAAFLGLDCMKLLEGAAAINHNFHHPETQPSLAECFADALDKFAGPYGFQNVQFRTWEKSLQAIADWAKELRSCGHAFVESKDASRRCVINWRVQSHRTDRLSIEDDATHSYPGKLNEQIDRFNTAMESNEIHVMELTLPHIDTHVLGQLIQLMMILQSMAD